MEINGSILIGMVVMAWLCTTIWYFYFRKPKMKSMVVDGVAVRSDEEVIVRPQQIVVNIIMEKDEAIDHSQLADMTVSVKDLVSGKYKFYEQDQREDFDLKDEAQAEYAAGETEEQEYYDMGDEPEAAPANDDDEIIPDLTKESNQEIITNLKQHNFNF